MSYRAPHLAVDFLSENFTGSPGDVLVLDVACGTGWVAKLVRFWWQNSFKGTVLRIWTCVVLKSHQVLMLVILLLWVQMFELGFRHFVGVDGSKGMLEQAAETGLYQDLKLALLGTDPLPAQTGTLHTLYKLYIHNTHTLSTVHTQYTMFALYIHTAPVWSILPH